MQECKKTRKEARNCKEARKQGRMEARKKRRKEARKETRKQGNNEATKQRSKEERKKGIRKLACKEARQASKITNNKQTSSPLTTNSWVQDFHFNLCQTGFSFQDILVDITSTIATTDFTFIFYTNCRTNAVIFFCITCIFHTFCIKWTITLI